MLGIQGILGGVFIMAQEYIVQDFPKGSRILLGMSGGVDSSVTAYLLKEQGYEVVGVSLKLFDMPDSSFDDAKGVAAKLGIEWHLADYTELFKASIIDYYVESYEKGETPNPCAKCNNDAKTYYLFTEMKKHQCVRIATGHYASKATHNGATHILGDPANPKDQSYYLALVNELLVELLVFPLAGMLKDDVRAIAAEAGLHVAQKGESQDACFLEGGDYRDYLKGKIQDKKGWFIYDGERLKEHEGVAYYTIGQRKGLDIGGLAEPLFVVDILASGDIVLGEKSRTGRPGVMLEKTNIIGNIKSFSRVEVKLRYRMNLQGGRIELLPDNRAAILFDKNQFAPAPGQVAAIYQDNRLVGGGFIATVL